jgi:hypothetical protein
VIFLLLLGWGGSRLRGEITRGAEGGVGQVRRMHAAHAARILSWQDPDSGSFRLGSASRGLADQGLVYPLAIAWLQSDAPEQRQELMRGIERAVGSLLDGAGRDGTTDLVGADGAIWKRHRDPWLYLHTIRAYAVVQRHLAPAVEQKWRRFLMEGFEGIAGEELPRAGYDNLPLVQAVALHIAASVFDKPRWRTVAGTFIAKVTAQQNPEGYWSEHQGPVVDYTFVYLYALGIHYAETSDEATRRALEKGVSFLYRMRYPDGTAIETVDERNYYRREPREGNIGFAFCNEGIRFVNEQYARTHYLWHYFTADLLNYGDRIAGGILAETPAHRPVSFIADRERIAVRSDGSWQRVVSAHVARQSPSRWIQDRQNFLSIYHEDAGLIVGGGNTKLQPRWSTFALGTLPPVDGWPGENPDFMAPKGRATIPDAAMIHWGEDLGVLLTYGPDEGRVRTRIGNDRSLTIEYERLTDGATPMAACVPIIPHPGKPIVSGGGEKAVLGAEPFVWSGGSLGGQFEHNGVRYAVPSQALVRWPVYPYDPYRKDGRTEIRNARIVIELPFSKTVRRQHVHIEVTGARPTIRLNR